MPGRKFSTTTWQVAASLPTRAAPPTARRSIETLRFPAFSCTYRPLWPWLRGPNTWVMSVPATST